MSVPSVEEVMEALEVAIDSLEREADPENAATLRAHRERLKAEREFVAAALALHKAMWGCSWRMDASWHRQAEVFEDAGRPSEEKAPDEAGAYMDDEPSGGPE